jgi:hypothetical protein
MTTVSEVVRLYRSLMRESLRFPVAESRAKLRDNVRAAFVSVRLSTPRSPRGLQMHDGWACVRLLRGLSALCRAQDAALVHGDAPLVRDFFSGDLERLYQSGQQHRPASRATHTKAKLTVDLNTNTSTTTTTMTTKRSTMDVSGAGVDVHVDDDNDVVAAVLTASQVEELLREKKVKLAVAVANGDAATTTAKRGSTK